MIRLGMFLSVGLTSLGLTLLASCSQNPVVDPTPQLPKPSTLSTDLNDAATHITTDAQGNAYIVGYRNLAVNTDVNSGGADLSAETFVGQFSTGGVLNWLTVLGTVQLDELRYTSGIITTDAAVYALTQAALDKNDGKNRSRSTYINSSLTVRFFGQKSSLKTQIMWASFSLPRGSSTFNIAEIRATRAM